MSKEFLENSAKGTIEAIENSADPRIEFLKTLLERVQKNRKLIEQKMEAEKMALELKEDHEIWFKKKTEELSKKYGENFVSISLRIVKALDRNEGDRVARIALDAKHAGFDPNILKEICEQLSGK